MISLLRCLTPWTHRYGWPRQGIETCADCGRTRPARVQFEVAERFNIPRHEPLKPMAKKRQKKIVTMARKGNV